MAQTRTTLRRSILHELGDLRVCTATAAGTTTTFIDANNLYGEPATYAGRLVYFSGGTAANLGEQRFVSGSSRDTKSLTFSQALPAATAVADELEMVNTYGMGFTFESVHHAINATIREAAPYALIPAVDTTVTAYDKDSPEIPIPAAWTHIEQVQFYDTSADDWRTIRHASGHGANGWSVDQPNREVVIQGRQRHEADGYAIRLYGYTEPTPLDADDDTTELDPEWLLYRCCARMLLNVVRSRQSGDWQGHGLYYQDQANNLKARLTPTIRSSTVRI